MQFDKTVFLWIAIFENLSKSHQVVFFPSLDHGSAQCSTQALVLQISCPESLKKKIFLQILCSEISKIFSVFSSSPEDAEVDKGHHDYVEPPDEDVEETDGVVGRQVDVGAGVQEVWVVLPHLNNYNISKWISIATNQTVDHQKKTGPIPWS